MFWFGESCLPDLHNLDLHSCMSPKRKGKKMVFTMIACFNKHSTAHSTTSVSLSISLSNSLSIALRPSVLLSPTPPSHITPLITLQWEGNLRECWKCVCVTGNASQECVTNPLSFFTSFLVVRSREIAYFNLLFHKYYNHVLQVTSILVTRHTKPKASMYTIY